MCKGGGTTTVKQSSSVPPQVMAAYTDAYQRALSAASQPYQQYSGQIVADWNPYQQAALVGSGTSAYGYTPYDLAAQGYLAAATQPFYQQVGLYENPYIQDVVDATQAQFNNQNSVQQAGIVGNAVASGAWGGDRSAVAQALTAGQQQTAQAPVIAGLYSQGYQQAMNAAEAQAWLNSQAAAQMGQLGAQNFAVDQSTLNQMMQFGQLYQGQQQAELNVPYYQWQAQQAYPFQTAGYLANIAEGIGSGMGGTSSTTSPAPSAFSQALGLGIGGLGLIGSTGGFGASGWLTGAGGLLGFLKRGGRIPHKAGGGGIATIPYEPMPIAGTVPDVGVSIIPQMSAMRAGIGPPRPPAVPNATSSTGIDLSPTGILKMGKEMGALGPSGWLSGFPAGMQSKYRGIAPEDTESFEDLIRPRYQGGGGIVGHMNGGAFVLPHYDDGGDVGDVGDDEGRIIGAPIPLDMPAGIVNGGVGRPGTVSFWMAQGAPQHVAQGIADRVEAESSFRPTVPGDKGTSVGLYQHHAGRKAALQSLPNWQDPLTQHEFALSEVTGGDPIATKHWAEILDAPDRQTAGMLWDRYFERSKDGPGAAGSRAAQPSSTDDEDIYTWPSSGGIAAAPVSAGADESVGIVPRATSVTPSQMEELKRPTVSPWLALAAAGFSMAAGRSPSAMQNIGAGALEGIKFLEGERQAMPKRALEAAQAELAQAQVGAYRAQQKWTQDGAVSNINDRITAAKKIVGGGGETVAIPSPMGAGAIAPAASAANPAPVTGGGSATAATVPPATPSAQSPAGASLPYGTPQDPYSPAWFDQEYGKIQHDIDRLRTFPAMPNQMLQLQEQIIARQQQLQQLRSMDPRGKAASVTAETGPLLQRKQGETDIEYANRVRTLRAENPILAERAGLEEHARAGEQPQQYVTTGPQGSTVERIAPRGQVMAGAAPGMGAPTPATQPATEGSRYDPAPESLIPTQPPAGQGVLKVNLTKAQEDKLQADAKEISEYREQAANVPVTLQRSQQLAEIIHNLSTGPILEHGHELMRYAQALGLDWLIPKGYKPADAEEVNKLATSLVFEQLKAIGGRPMVAEIQGLRQANPSVALTPEANLAILSNLAAEANYAQDRFLNASRVFSKYGQLGNFDQRYLENTPVKDIYAKNREIIGAGQTSASQQAARPPRPDAFRGADGQWHVIENGQEFIMRPRNRGP